MGPPSYRKKGEFPTRISPKEATLAGLTAYDLPTHGETFLDELPPHEEE